MKDTSDIAKIKSLGYRTDFLFNKYDGHVIDRGEYFLVETLSNPHFFWGNLLLYRRAPTLGDYQQWKLDFEKEFQHLDLHHMTFAWDCMGGEEGDPSEFLAAGFDLDRAIVLSTDKVILPPKFNKEVEVKLAETQTDFESSIEIQTRCGHDGLSEEAWKGFYRNQFSRYKKLIELGVGHWFAAYVDGVMAGCLGIFTEGKIGRFQIVSTDPSFQRRGVCSTLVYKSSQYAFSHMGVDTLVMIADEDYHAAKIYESVGFRPTETLAGLCWYDKERYKDQS